MTVFFTLDLDKVTPNKFIPMFNRSIIRMGETPSGNAHCSARGMARIGAAVVDGGSIDGEYSRPSRPKEISQDLTRKLSWLYINYQILMNHSKKAKVK